MGSEFGELIRTRDQRQNAVADQIGGGEIASHQQQVTSNNDLALGKPILRPRCGDKSADEVGATPAVSLIHRTREVIIQALLGVPEFELTG
jgi:hypothetical protein